MYFLLGFESYKVMKKKKKKYDQFQVCLYRPTQLTRKV